MREQNNMVNRSVTIMIVDDSRDNLELLSTILKKESFRTHSISSGIQALELAPKLRPDLILLDIMMPEIDGYEVCYQLKNSPKTVDIPVIFISSKNKPDDKILGFDAGAVDYITKPFHRAETLSRIRTHLALKDARDELHRANQEIIIQNKKLEMAYQELQTIARTDSLTQLSNRGDLYRHLEAEKSRFGRNQKPFSLILCDIDNFKKINDTYGHDCGDYVLVHTANLFKKHTRLQDIIGRWGGEEFLFILPETSTAGAEIVAEKVREAIDYFPFMYDEKLLKVSITLGITLYDNFELSIDDAVKQADEALYLGKMRGKNRSVLYSEIRNTLKD
ncbi:MAG TPA: diguanylate cyclase [Candidatus Marinimicrobia bacterium]|nr:diguanylate cyclase [Candidatus Neomarinimicrobiota bacterium]